MLPDAHHENEKVDLVVTDQRSQGRYVVTLNGKIVRLSYGQLQLLTMLIKTQSESRGRGYFEDLTLAYPAAVCRLRKSIDEALGNGRGKEIIETGVGAEYRLAPFVQVSAIIDGTSGKRGSGLGLSNSARLSAA